MLRILRHGDVTELRFSTLRSRTIRYGVSAFFTQAALVDSGFPDVRNELRQWLRDRPKDSPVEGAIITHGHEDHGGNVGLLASRGVPIQIADASEQALRHPGPIGFYRRYAWGNYRALRRVIAPFAHPRLHLVPAPGHSPDHHVVLDPESGTVFGGDLYIGTRVKLVHHDEDPHAQVATLRTVASWHPERYFDAHRGRLRDPVRSLRAKAQWMSDIIGAIETKIAAGWDDARIRDTVLGREELTGVVSRGDYSRLNFVRNVRAAGSAVRPQPPAARRGQS